MVSKAIQKNKSLRISTFVIPCFINNGVNNINILKDIHKNRIKCIIFLQKVVGLFLSDVSDLDISLFWLLLLLLSISLLLFVSSVSWGAFSILLL